MAFVADLPSSDELRVVDRLLGSGLGRPVLLSTAVVVASSSLLLRSTLRLSALFAARFLEEQVRDFVLKLRHRQILLFLLRMSHLSRLLVSNSVLQESFLWL